MRNRRNSPHRVCPAWAVSRLTTLPDETFRSVVFHLVSGGSVSATARYLKFLTGIDKNSRLKRCGTESLRRYLTAMKSQLRLWLQSPNAESTPSWLMPVLESVRTDSDGREVQGTFEVDAEIRAIALARHANARAMLHEAFHTLANQEKNIAKLEKHFGMILPAGTRTVVQMLGIAKQLANIEMLEACPELKLKQGRLLIRRALEVGT